MSNCNINKIISDKLSVSKLTKTQEIDITIMSDIDSCLKINTRKFEKITGTSSAYTSRTIAPDLINTCESFGCKNTGTLFITSKETDAEGADGNKVHTSGAVFKALKNALDFAAGVVYYYVNVPQAGTYTITTKISDVLDHEMTNADEYTTTLKADKEGFYPVQIDLSTVPTKTSGKGWEASTSGVRLSIEVALTDKSADSILIGISSISFFEEFADLDSNNDIKVSCLSGFDGDDTVDPVDTSCFDDSYDDDSASIERSFTGTQLTSNYLTMNPLIGKGDKSQGFMMRTQEVVIEADKEHPEYGSIHIADHYVDECGFIYAALSDQCNITDSTLNRINTPLLANLDESQYQVLNSKINPSLDIEGSKIYFNKNLVGKTLKISYPMTVDVLQHYVANNDSLKNKRAKVTITRYRSDGTAEVFTYHNAKITSFPMGIPDDGAFEFSLAFKKDTRGNWYEVYVVNKANANL